MRRERLGADKALSGVLFPLGLSQPRLRSSAGETRARVLSYLNWFVGLSLLAPWGGFALLSGVGRPWEKRV